MPHDDRERMVAVQIEARGITDPLVREAMREVPRERHARSFVPLIGAEGWTEEGQG
jgi:protein-L-isoaspartate O-methyltransferase